jgi:hypothetical protein
MSAEGVKQFIKALDLLFPMPQFGGDKTRQAALQQTYAVALHLTDDDLLAAARDHFIRTRNPEEDPSKRFFPPVAECLKVIRDLAEERDRRQVPLLPKPSAMTHEQRVIIAREIMRLNPLGQQAKREGWAPSMFEYVIEYGKAPEGDAIASCKASAKAFRTTHERLLKGEDEHPFRKAWLGFVDGMIRKTRERMGEKAA